MAKIVDLKSFRDKSLELKCFGPWQKRFGDAYGIDARVSDLSDKVLFCLAQPGESSSLAFYELIMGALELGPAAKFHYLDNDEQMQVVDIHLLLADLVRYEMMRRLGWVGGFAGGRLSLVEAIRNFKTAKQLVRSSPPELSEAHPDYSAYCRLTGGDKDVFIRRLLRDAIDAFKQHLGE